MVRERFVRLEVAAGELGLTTGELLELVRSGELAAIRLSGTWRVERAMVEQFIGRLYERSARMLSDLPAGVDVPVPDLPASDQRPADRPAAERGATPAHIPASEVTALPPQMRRVLELIATGMSNAEIAGELTLEVSTVKSHVSRLLSRLGLPNRERLIAYAWRSGAVAQER